MLPAGQRVRTPARGPIFGLAKAAADMVTIGGCTLLYRHFAPRRLSMAMKIEKIDVWSGEIRDEVGGLTTALDPLVTAGADFTFLIARRQPERPGTGILFLGGLRGAKQTKAAQTVGIAKSADVAGLRLEAADKPGL